MQTWASTVTRVYPRVGGGTPSGLLQVSPLTGLSPRGRGNPMRLSGMNEEDGSIPAWAGEPSGIAKGAGHGAVYPRVGGGTLRHCKGSRAWSGLSPRGRGNPQALQREQGMERSIPAWAGEPSRASPTHWTARVYPRVGGGTGNRVLWPVTLPGLSRVGGGNHVTIIGQQHRKRSIPAWAGEPPEIER